MTETDELVAMLNERGVEHDETFEDGADYIWWSDGERDLFARSYHGGLAVYGLSARHAIEATLGRGECRNEGDQSDFLCSECGGRMFTDTGDTYTMIDSLGNIIEQPKYCPNCGARVVEVDE